MGLTRADLLGEMSDEERAGRLRWIEQTQANDVWAKKIFHKVGVLLTSHPGNRAYLKASVESHVKLGFWICLAYDNYFHPHIPADQFDYNQFMPAKDVMGQVDSFLIPHYNTWGGVLYPYFWLLKWGTAAMRQFEYIYCANGDMVIEKPEGFPELFALLGDADVMTTGPDRDGAPPTANTAGFLIKSEALERVVQHMQDHLVPWDVYEKHTQEIGNMEGRFGRAIQDLELKQVRVDPPLEDMLREPGHGTWANVLGFRHIHSEHNFAYRYKKIPPHYKYLDERFMGDEYHLIKQYWNTQDMSVLENWWAK